MQESYCERISPTFSCETIDPMRLLRIFVLAFCAALAVSACGGGGGDETAADPDGSSGEPDGSSGEPDGSSGDPDGSSGEPDGSSGDDSDPGTDGATGFSTAVLPIIEGSCARCHTGDGPGTPHLRMDTVGDVVENTKFIVEVLSTNFMPPWPASEESVLFADNWNLSDAERQALLDWAGHPLVDVDEDTVIAPTAGVQRLTEIDLEISAIGAYDGEQYQDDMYRCLIYDPEFDSETWLRGFEFLPDQTEVVHHAIGYLMGADLRTKAGLLDAEYPEQGGWPCFGSSRLGNDEIFLGWAPGQGPTELPEGSAMRMGAGDFIVMQIHYHFEVEAPADHSTFAIDTAEADAGPFDEVQVVEFLAPAEIPCSSDESGPLCDRDAALARAYESYGGEGVLANETLRLCEADVDDFAHMTDGVASSSCDLPARVGGQLISVLGHEHELGSSFRMTLHPDTPAEVVLLDIPDWRFGWQLNYYLEDQIDISPQDTVRIECTWDRSLRDPDLEPAYVVWADGTNDEMCFATMLIRT